MADINVTRDPQRRSAAMSMLSIGIVVFAYISLARPWYAMLIESPGVTVPGTFETTGAVRASAFFNAFDLTQSGTAMTHTGPVAALGSIAGMPTPVVLLALAASAIIATAVLRNGLFALVAFTLVYYARMLVATSRSLVENPMYGGEYMAPQTGLAWFSFAIVLLIALCALVGIQVATANRRSRQQRRAAGESVPGLFDILYSAHQGALARASQRYQENQSRTAKHTN
jgi:hypothetical protein